MKKSTRRPRKKSATALTEVLLSSACRVLQNTGAEFVMVYADSLPDPGMLDRLLENIPVVLVTRDSSAQAAKPACVKATISVPGFSLTRMDQIKLATVVGLARGVLKKGQKIVCLAGIAGARTLDTLMVVETGTELEMFTASGGDSLISGVKHEVLVKTIDIAARLSLEGREGKPLGTMFVLGDAKKVLSHTKQMTINPFHGYPEEKCNILSPELEETLKEFASIDGAFIVRGDGVVLSAGTYLQPPGSDKPLEPGLGARHAAAAAITEATQATAIALSESTGTVRMYRDGSVVMAIERPKGLA